MLDLNYFNQYKCSRPKTINYFFTRYIMNVTKSELRNPSPEEYPQFSQITCTQCTKPLNENPIAVHKSTNNEVHGFHPYCHEERLRIEKTCVICNEHLSKVGRYFENLNYSGISLTEKIKTATLLTLKSIALTLIDFQMGINKFLDFSKLITKGAIEIKLFVSAFWVATYVMSFGERMNSLRGGKLYEGGLLMGISTSVIMIYLTTEILSKLTTRMAKTCENVKKIWNLACRDRLTQHLNKMIGSFVFCFLKLSYSISLAGIFLSDIPEICVSTHSYKEVLSYRINTLVKPLMIFMMSAVSLSIASGLFRAAKELISLTQIQIQDMRTKSNS